VSGQNHDKYTIAWRNCRACALGVSDGTWLHPEESDTNVGTSGFFKSIRDRNAAKDAAAAQAAISATAGTTEEAAEVVAEEVVGEEAVAEDAVVEDVADADTPEVDAAPEFEVQTSVQVQGGFVTETTPEATADPILVTNREMQEITDKYANDLSYAANLPEDTSYVAMVEINSNGEGGTGTLQSLTQAAAVSAIPIPGALPLMVLGFGALAAVSRRRG